LNIGAHCRQEEGQQRHGAYDMSRAQTQPEKQGMLRVHASDFSSFNHLPILLDKYQVKPAFDLTSVSCRSRHGFKNASSADRRFITMPGLDEVDSSR
jgi:hypothetical protein